MEFRLGNSRWVHQRGETVSIVCPECKNKVNFGVFSNFERHLAVKATLLDCKNVYFLYALNVHLFLQLKKQEDKPFKNVKNYQ